MRQEGDHQRLELLSQIYSPRTTLKNIMESQNYLLSNLTLYIDRYTIQKIRQEFEAHNGALSLVEFVQLLRGHFAQWNPEPTQPRTKQQQTIEQAQLSRSLSKKQIPNRDIKLNRCLLELYNELDGGRNNGKVEWQRFTNYIIGKVTQLKSSKTQVRPYTKATVPLREKFANVLHKVIYIEELDRLAFFEYSSDRVFLMNHQTGQLNLKPLIIFPQPLTVETSSMKKDRDGKLTIKKKQLVIPTKTVVLDILYIPDPKYKMLLTSTNDGVVRGWKFQGTSYVLAPQPENEGEPIKHEFVEEIFCMSWDSLNEVLYCSDDYGGITMWSLKTDQQTPLGRSFRDDHKKKTENLMQQTSKVGVEGHNKNVTSMITMPKLQFMASGGMDGKLILWDTIKNNKKWVYREHNRGITSLAFNERLILLFSAGFDHQICIWNPYISNVIHKVQAHSSPIYSMKVVGHQLLSMDMKGTIKVLDVRTFVEVNSFEVESPDDKVKMEPMCLEVIPKPLKLAISGKTICQFEYDKNYVPNAVDDNMALCCKAVPSLLSLYTPVGPKIKVWSLLTGEVDKIFNDLSKGQITAFCLNRKQTEAIIGDSTGLLKIINLKNGTFQKQLPRHNGEISFILAIQALKINELIVTAGMDNEIRLLKENDAGRYEILRNIFIRKEVSISYLAYSERAKTIIVGTNYGVIGFYEVETGKLTGSTPTGNIQTSVTSINVLEDLPYIIETNSSGRISVVATPPHQLRFSRVFSIIQPDNESSNDSSKITCSLFRRKRLFVGDDKGYLKCYDFSSVLDELATLYNRPDEGGRIAITDINYFWSIKAHNQSIRSVDFLSEETLLATSSYDKRVKLWYADSGGFVDQLEQNFMKDDPKPLAFQKIDSTEVYATNFKDRLPVKSDEMPSVQTLEFNPRWLFDRIDLTKVSTTVSNSHWKVQPVFDGFYRKQQQQYQQLEKQLKDAEEISKKESTRSKRQKTSQLLLPLGITPEKSAELLVHRSPSQSAADNLRQIRDKDFNVRKKFMDDIKHLMIKKPNETEDMRVKAHRQRQYSNSLYHQQPIARLYFKDDKVVKLSQAEANAAYNLSAALTNVDEQDHRALKFVNNVMVRDKSSRSMQHQRSISGVKLPPL